ncbi:hypothetical protein KKF94_01300 [Patescibacteria group bacterium]|nr:hypothetical protein [Patescibacteria group bacterium]
MENKKETQLSDLIKIGLLHSIAQAFLIFSGALVIVSVWKNSVYIPLSFFTLFYALINFKIEATRKHPPMGNYGMRTNLGTIFYTLISWSLLIWWIIGLSIMDNNLGLLLNYKCWYFYVSVACLILILIWIIIIFYEKRKDKNLAIKYNKRGYYEVACVCGNCDLDSKLYIRNGVRVNDAICSNCGVIQQLKRKKDEEIAEKKKNNQIIIQNYD